VAAQGCYLLAAHHGPLPLVGLVTSAYPAAIVVLAAVVLGERLDARLLGAVAATLLGVVLMRQ
jgi:drug/metabolite transporter (DMT)-like permease